MKFCFDIDGVICSNTWGKYEQAEPINKNIDLVKNLYKAGHRIILWTARGSMTGKNWREVTENQLSNWGVNYHELVFGKPEADVYIDDRAVNITDFEEFCKQNIQA